MKKIIILLLAVIVTSCGNNNSNKNQSSEDDYKKFKPKLINKKIKAKTEEISGELGEYLTIKKPKTKVSYLSMNKPFAADWAQEWEIKINVERTKKKLAYDIETINGNYTHLIITIFDSDGIPISGLNSLQNESGHDLVDQVLSLKEGQDAWVSFVYRKGNINEEDIIKDWDQYSIGSEIGFVKNSSSTYDTAQEESEIKISSNGSEDWDKMLDDYEDYVDEYLKFFKKAMDGDVNALSEYPKLMNKANNLQQSMEKAQNNDELSASQIQRMMKIQMKMANAALEM